MMLQFAWDVFRLNSILGLWIVVILLHRPIFAEALAQGFQKQVLTSPAPERLLFWTLYVMMLLAAVFWPFIMWRIMSVFPSKGDRHDGDNRKR